MPGVASRPDLSDMRDVTVLSQTGLAPQLSVLGLRILSRSTRRPPPLLFVFPFVSLYGTDYLLSGAIVNEITHYPQMRDMELDEQDMYFVELHRSYSKRGSLCEDISGRAWIFWQ
ncbi:hypothetical protein NDU88_003405 [Pleurodeles waltl]|uniref:Uncharacterized protein n=1 Tax=Pleurodeles waltl TaxID=8319 RepID=A0AAV7SFS0_PLEWA|nr:hypothetical protein NDU88_003405 [Pleurodeles waltl]